MTNRYAGARTVERRTVRYQEAYAKHLVAELRDRPPQDISAICDRLRAARGMDTRTAVAIAEAAAEAHDRHDVGCCRVCGESFYRMHGVWLRYCSRACAAQERGRNRVMRTVEDARVLHADHIEADPESGRLTVNGRRPTRHPSTVVVDLSEMSDLELHLAANAFLHVLYRRWPREARLLDRTHEGAA